MWDSRLLVASVLNRHKEHRGMIPHGLKAQSGREAVSVEDPTKNTVMVPSSLVPWLFEG